MLFDLFTHTRAIRRNIIEAGQETAAPDFGRRAGEEQTAGEKS
jgi:cyclohexadieny/prephenate dehydrogenase